MKYYDTSFDTEFDNIQDLKWHPWIGKDYQKSAQKTLIIGDSHYNWAKKKEDKPKATQILDNPDFTRKLINNQCLQHLLPSKYDEPKFFTNTVRAINYGQNTSLKEKIWFNHAFYNFVQRPMSHKKGKPKKKDYQTSWKVFEELVQVIQPTYCIFMGLRASNYFDKTSKSYFDEWSVRQIRKEDKISRARGRSVHFQKENLDIRGVMVRHPSSHFSWRKWHKYIKKQLPEYIEYLQETTKS